MDGQIQPAPLRCGRAPGRFTNARSDRVAAGVLVVGSVRLQPDRVAQQHASWPQFRGNPQLTGVSASTLPRRRSRSCGHSTPARPSSRLLPSPTAPCSSDLPQASWSPSTSRSGAVRWRYKTGEIGESSPAVGQWRGLHRRSDGGRFTRSMQKPARRSGRSKRWARFDRRRSSSATRADRILRPFSVRALDRQGHASRGRWSSRDTCMPRQRSLDGVAYISGCDETFRGIRVADGREVLNVPIGRLHGRVGGAGGRGRVCRHVRERSDRHRHESAEGACGRTVIPSGCFRITRRRPSARGASCSAAATRWSTRSTRRPARRSGRS